MTWNSALPVASSLASSAEMRTAFGHIERSLFGVNLLADSTFLIWPHETVNTATATGLAHWTIAGTGALQRRCGVTLSGTALTDTERKVGKHSCMLRYGSAAATLSQDILTTGAYDDYFDGLTVTFGCWLKTSAISAAHIRISDGVGNTDSSFHTGGSSWEWVTATRTIDSAATKITATIRQAAAGDVYISGPTFLFGEIPPQTWIPSPIVYGTIFLPIAGEINTGTNQARYVCARPMLVKDTQLRIETAPTGASLIVDVNQGDGATQTTMYSTKPTLAISGKNGGLAPEAAAYSKRCFASSSGSGTPTAAVLSIDVDQVGSTIKGSDLGIHVRALQFARPLEDRLGISDVA